MRMRAGEPAILWPDALLLFTVGWLSGNVTLSADMIELTVVHGDSAQEAVLQWNGGMAPFNVYRSSDPDFEPGPANLIDTTSLRVWADDSPPQDIWHYQVLDCVTCSLCTGAIEVAPPGGRIGFPLASATHTGSCGTAVAEAILTFTVSETSDVFISTHQAGNVDTVVYVRAGDCLGPELACNDDADGLLSSTLRLTALSPGTYFVFVGTRTSTQGSLPVDVYITASAPASDRCGNPSLIPAGSTFLAGSTCGYNSDYVPAADAACSQGAGHAVDRVYYFYLPAATTISINGCQPSSNYDQTLYLRAACTDGSLAAQPACNDDGCTGLFFCGQRTRSSLVQSLAPGLYYLIVDGYADGSVPCPCGNFGFALTGF